MNHRWYKIWFAELLVFIICTHEVVFVVGFTNLQVLYSHWFLWALIELIKVNGSHNYNNSGYKDFSKLSIFNIINYQPLLHLLTVCTCCIYTAWPLSDVMISDWMMSPSAEHLIWPSLLRLNSCHRALSKAADKTAVARLIQHLK